MSGWSRWLRVLITITPSMYVPLYVAGGRLDLTCWLERAPSSNSTNCIGTKSSPATVITPTFRQAQQQTPPTTSNPSSSSSLALPNSPHTITKHSLALKHSTMASQSQQISTTTVILATAGTLAAGAIAYAAYFDYRRRSDPEFRKNLKKQHKKVQKAKEEEGKAAEQGQKERIKNAVQEANEEGFPRDPEETEGYFMQEVARGEGMCQDGSDPVDAALCFYKALKVYPQPRELITIYDKTVPKVCCENPCPAFDCTNILSLAHP
jgi:import receptor subunit TOM20